MPRAFYKENRINRSQSSELPNIMDPFPGRLPVSDTEPVFLFFQHLDACLMVDELFLHTVDFFDVRFYLCVNR